MKSIMENKQSQNSENSGTLAQYYLEPPPCTKIDTWKGPVH